MTTVIRPVTAKDLPEEDRRQITLALKRWQSEGQSNPLIPCDVDVDGDGQADAYGLDAFGTLVYVTEVPLRLTTYESTGGFETGEESDD